jgi:hypothetical protein
MSEEKRKVSDELKIKIIQNLIEPSYYSDVVETLHGRKCWRISGHTFESISKIILAVSGILSFAAGVYDDKILSFVAGTLSTVSLATFQFSLYAFKQHKKNALELNMLLNKLDIDTIPVFPSRSNMMARKMSTVEEKETQKDCEIELGVIEFHDDNSSSDEKISTDDELTSLSSLRSSTPFPSQV